MVLSLEKLKENQNRGSTANPLYLDLIGCVTFLADKIQNGSHDFDFFQFSELRPIILGKKRCY